MGSRAHRFSPIHQNGDRELTINLPGMFVETCFRLLFPLVSVWLLGTAGYQGLSYRIALIRYDTICNTWSEVMIISRHIIIFI